MIYVRSMDPDAPRTGEWAHLFSIQHNEDMQDIWIVEFPDGATDAWPSWNALASYDVKVQIEVPEPEVAPSDNPSNAQPTVWDTARGFLLAQASARYQAR